LMNTVPDATGLNYNPGATQYTANLLNSTLLMTDSTEFPI